MNHAYSTKMRATLWAILGIACLAPVPTLAQVGRDMGCSPTLASPCSGGSTGGGSGNAGAAAIGGAIGAAIGAEIHDALFGNAQKEEELRAAAVRSDADRQARRATDIQRAQGLLDQMLDTNTAPSSETTRPDAGTGGALGLMLGDAPIRRLETSGSAQSIKSGGFTQGFERASQCYSQDSGLYCTGVAVEQQQACLADYRSGYEVGQKQRERLMQEAMQAGHLAGGRGELANGASNPLADGPCRVEWIQTYNQGYFQGRHAKAQ